MIINCSVLFYYQYREHIPQKLRFDKGLSRICVKIVSKDAELTLQCVRIINLSMEVVIHVGAVNLGRV